MSDERGRPRRAGAQPGLRTAAVQAALDSLAARRSADLGRPLRVLDVGGGTGGTAVPLRGRRARRHRRRPQPRRPRVPGPPGRRDRHLRAHPPRCRATPTPSVSSRAGGERPAFDLVCLHGTLKVVDDPGPRWPTRGVLAPDGTLSLVVAQRLPAAVGPDPGRGVRAGPGDARASRRALGRSDPSPRRFDESAERDLATVAGLTRVDSHGGRISATSCPRPWSTPRPSGPRCSRWRKSLASSRGTRCSATSGRAARGRDPGLTPAGKRP